MGAGAKSQILMWIDLVNMVTTEMVARENGVVEVSREWVENKDKFVRSIVWEKV